MKKFIITLLAVLMLFAFTGCGGSKYDVVHDEDGFLGYSDSFWEWYDKNN